MDIWVIRSYIRNQISGIISIFNFISYEINIKPKKQIGILTDPILHSKIEKDEEFVYERTNAKQTYEVLKIYNVIYNFIILIFLTNTYFKLL